MGRGEMAYLPKSLRQRLMMPALRPSDWGGRAMQRYLREFSASLQVRLLRGEHLMLLGPRGSGKSEVLQEVYARLRRSGAPCAYCPVTKSLDHITCALESAYPGVDTDEITRRAARVRLWNAADRRMGVLLLDEFCGVSTALVAFLRRLHGKIAGVLSAVDVDDERERRAVRPWRYGATSVRMPLATKTQLSKLLLAREAEFGLSEFDAPARARFVAAARGRPGWIVECTELARQPRYRCEHGLLVSVLCIDTEAAVRYRSLEMLRPDIPPRAQRWPVAYYGPRDQPVRK